MSRTYQQATLCVFENKGKDWKKIHVSLCLSDLCWWKACLRNKCRPASGKTSEVESDGQGVIDQRKLEEDSWR